MKRLLRGLGNSGKQRCGKSKYVEKCWSTVTIHLCLPQGRLLCDQNVDSITLCYYMAPFNLTILATASALTEGTRPFRTLFKAESSFAEQFYLWIWLLVSGFLACSFNILSYMTIKHLSPVGTNVIANAKTPAIILMSTLFFGNPVRRLQWLGLLVTFFGILLHSRKGRLLEVDKKWPKPGRKQRKRKRKSLWKFWLKSWNFLWNCETDWNWWCLEKFKMIFRFNPCFE